MRKFIIGLAVYAAALYGLGTMLVPPASDAGPVAQKSSHYVWLYCHAPDWQYPYKHWHKMNGVHIDYKCYPSANINWWYYTPAPWPH